MTESGALTTDSPKDMRDNVVFELLSTERKYVQDLEALQVGLSLLITSLLQITNANPKKGLYERSTKSCSTKSRYNALFIWKFKCTS